MAYLWSGLGLFRFRVVMWTILWALHMPQWVLKVKDVITCSCNSMLGYYCLIEC